MISDEKNILRVLPRNCDTPHHRPAESLHHAQGRHRRPALSVLQRRDGRGHRRPLLEALRQQNRSTAATNRRNPRRHRSRLFEQRTPIDLSNPRLRKLAAALGPAYMRVSGTWANTIYFQDSDAPPPATPPEGFGGVLTRPQWKGVVEFSNAVNAKSSLPSPSGAELAISRRLDTSRSEEIPRLHALHRRHIAAAEFMNEPTFATAAGLPDGYDAAAYGRDFAVFQPFFRKAAPHAILLGPGSVGEGIDFVPTKLLPTKDMLDAIGPNPGRRFLLPLLRRHLRALRAPASPPNAATTPDAALTEDWLTRTGTVEEFYAGLRDTYAPGKPMWLTETGQTACGGDRWASTFLDSFRYLDQMGRLAKRNVQVIMHNTLAASDYGLIDEKTLIPRPNYWAALLWHNTWVPPSSTPAPHPQPPSISTRNA